MAGEMRWVLVSGGTRGIGRSIVLTLAAQGYQVVFTYRSSKEEAEVLVAHMREQGRLCEGYACDMSSADETSKLAKELIAKYGPPFALVNNAGITKDSLFMSMTFDQWRDVFATNVHSAYFVNRAFLNDMIAAGDGCIIHMSSVVAFKGNIGQGNYAASKSALIGLTRSLAIELGRFNIRVNAIAPGLIETDMTRQIPVSQRRKLLSNIPLGRLGTVEEVAGTVEFLVGPGGRYITGQTFVVDGGLTA
jgi:3-oxoacyl-[acyl-carrier protein] reductase